MMDYIYNTAMHPLYTTSDKDTSNNAAKYILIFVIIVAIIGLILTIFLSLKKSSSKRRHPILVFLLVSAIVVTIILGILKLYDISNQKSNGGTNNDGNPIQMTRSATNADLKIEEGDVDWFSAGCVYVITPYCDIQNLSFQITIYNDKKTIGQKSVQLGNVSKNKSYNATFSLSELSMSFRDIIDAFSSTYYWKYEVTGGTVSYFT